MLIALNQLRRRHRQRLAAVLLALALCCLLVAAHSALAERHMGDDMAICLAVAQTAALALSIAVRHRRRDTANPAMQHMGSPPRAHTDPPRLPAPYPALARGASGPSGIPIVSRCTPPA
ncbi:MAG: hypothetical protein ACLGI5_19625 [Thermoleophilia bacterium]